VEWAVSWSRNASGGKRSATGASKDWFSEVHAGEVVVVVKDEGKVDGTGTNVMGLVGNSFEYIIIKKGKFEVGWLVMVSEVVVRRPGYDVSVDVIRVNGRCGEDYGVKIGVENAAFRVQRVDKVLQLGVVKVGWGVGEDWRGEAKKVVLPQGDGCHGWKDGGVAVKLFSEE